MQDQKESIQVKQFSVPTWEQVKLYYSIFKEIPDSDWKIMKGGSVKITEMVKEGKKVKFKFYRQGNLYYETEDGFVFPVPVEDTGEATFLNEDKAILFMRYIRKQIAVINEGKIN